MNPDNEREDPGFLYTDTSRGDHRSFDLRLHGNGDVTASLLINGDSLSITVRDGQRSIMDTLWNSSDEARDCIRKMGQRGG